MIDLRSIAASVARTALGGVLGLALVAGFASAPASAFAQATAPAAVPQATGQGPALWVVRDADSTIYLFGTVHVLRPTTAWGTKKVDDAFASASEIWFEVSNPDDTAALMPLIQQYGLSPQTPLSSLLTPTELNDLNAAAQTMGAGAAQLDAFRPWFAGLTLSVAPLTKAGYAPGSGAEMNLMARAKASGVPIHGLETLDKQVRILATLPDDIQLQFLRSTLKDFDDATTELDQLVDAWAVGDVAAIAHLGVDDMKTQAPAIYQALLVDRNADWAGQIQTLLAGSGVAFIAVGAAHLAGDDSVQSILERRGVVVERE